LDDADDVGLRLARGHEVDHAHATRRRLPFRLEDQRVATVTPVRGGAARRRCDEPPSVLGAAEQGAEAGARVESRERQPVDGAGPPHERCRLQVAEERVVLYPLRHQPPSSPRASSGKRLAAARVNARTYASRSSTVRAYWSRISARMSAAVSTAST